MTSSYYYFDAISSARQLCDSSQVTTDDAIFKAYGETAAETGTTPNPHKWIGEQGYYHEEATHRYVTMRRQYAAAIGRFLSLDPPPPEGDDHPNKFVYVRDTPLTLTDPWGTKCTDNIPGLTLHRIKVEWLTIFKTKGQEGDWGHWWIELGSAKGNGFEKGMERSYGWWPKNQVPGTTAALKGVPGQLNGMFNDAGDKLLKWDEDHDSHHGDRSGKDLQGQIEHDLLKRQTLNYGAEKGRTCCSLHGDVIFDVIAIIDCVIAAAKDFAKHHTTWRYPGSYNCHSFQRWLLRQCCICEPSLFAKDNDTYDAPRKRNNDGTDA